MNRDRKLIFLTVLYFAILGCFLLGCSEGADSSPVSALMGNLNSSYLSNKLSGVVLDSSTNEPMSNIYVQLLDVNSVFVKGALTAFDGTFSFIELEPGTYSVNIVKEGYEPPERPTINCYIANGTSFDNYVLYLKSTSSNTTTEKIADISGKVRRSDGSSAANSPIVLSLDKNGNSIVGNESLVMGDGSFAFFSVPAGKTYFIIVGDNNSTEKAVYPIGIDADGNVSPSKIEITVIVETETNSVNNVTFEISSAYTGASLEFATLKVNGENKGTTNIKGEITVDKLSIGSCNIEVSKEGFETLTTIIPIDANSNQEPFKLTMIEDTKDGYGSITGRYVNEGTGNGLGEKYVRLYRLIERTQSSNQDNKSETWYDVDKKYILTTKTSNGNEGNGLEGSFKLTHIEPGYYQVYVSNTATIPSTEQRSQVYDDFVWTQLATDTAGCLIITQPLKVVSDQTTYWTNYEQGNN